MSEKGFRNFRITDVHSTWSDRAARYALTSLTGRNNGPIKKSTMVQNASKLIETWRARVLNLRARDWDAVKTPAGLVFAGNCPPTGVYTDQTRLRRCGHSSVCPFCWSEVNVYKPFEKFKKLLFASESPSLDFDLIEAHYKRLYDVNAGRDLPRHAFDWVKDMKGKYVQDRIDGCIGAFVVCSIEPPSYHSRVKRPYYFLHHRLLAIIDQFGKTPPENRALKMVSNRQEP